MARTLLLCFIHGFKGNDDTFRRFPEDLEREVGRELEGHHVESVVYPKYETKGELLQCTTKFLEWLKERVMDIRKKRLSNPWPPHDRDVSVVLVAHSMGGFVAIDALFHALDERLSASSDAPSKILFPNIQGILSFDTPYNGLSRSMFVYGAFSNYNKVSSVFNVMTALSAGPAALSRVAMRRAGAGAIPSSVASRANPAAWKAWQLVAVRTGTVGAIAAGGVAAYVHRKKIMEGISTARNMGVTGTVQSGMDALGQGLAYVNRGNVGASFEWLSDHITFVGALMKPTELSRRLARMAALKGVGIRDYYASLGENGYWSGGYFVPERTFCAVPQDDQSAAKLFERRVVKEVGDEVDAHLSLFIPEKNMQYEKMTEDSAKLVVQWFDSDEDIFDDPGAAKDAALAEPEAEAAIRVTDDGVEITGDEKLQEAQAGEGAGDDPELPDESPIDVAAAASLVPLPDDDESLAEVAPTEEAKQTYMRHLFGVAQQAGTGLKRVSEWSSVLPSKIPKIDGMSTPTMPSLPTMPKVGVPSMPALPTMPKIFSKKQGSSASESKPEETRTDAATEDAAEGQTAEQTTAEEKK